MISDLLREAREAGISFFVDEGKLRIRSSAEDLPPGLDQRIRRHEAEIIQILESSRRHARRQPAHPAIRRRRPGSRIPLSHSQQRLWFLDRLSATPTAEFNLRCAFRIRGSFDVNVAERVFHDSIRRHEILRTVYREDASGSFQQPLESFEFHIERWNFSDLPAEEQRRVCDDIIQRQSQTPFDLTVDLPLRAGYIAFGPEDGVLFLTIHHIAADAWSMNILMREFQEAYTGQAPPPLELQYGDYAAWQREHMDEANFQNGLDYWRTQLKDLPIVHSLPLAKPRPSRPSLRGWRVRSLTPPDVLKALRQTARDSDCSLFMLLHAAFAILLSRYSSSHDIVIGAPVANRGLRELDPLIGFFVNTLVLRVDTSKNEKFSDFLTSVRDVNAAAQARQMIPFEALVEELNPPRTTRHTPLFQILLSMEVQNQGGQVSAIGGLTCEPVKSEEQIAKFDLSLAASTAADGLHLEFTFAADLFETSFIEQMGRHLGFLLQGISSEPRTRIHDLAMLSADERNELLGFASAVSHYPHETCVHEMLEQQAAERPEAIAVVCGDRSLTYEELNSRANYLAHELIARKVRPGALIGVCIDRSVELIVALVGILKAGGAYVPLDPTLPKERLSFIAQDSGVALIVTRESLASELPESAELLLLDDRYAPAPNPGLSIPPESLAYVIYTSGSTGRPKGVEVTHRNVTRLFTATRDWYRFDQHDVWPMFHTVAFDVSVWEIWGALIYGGRLVVVPREITRSPSEFLQLIADQGVTVLNQTPSAFAPLMHAEARQPQAPALALRVVVFAGEALDVQSLRPWFERHGDAVPQMVNMYGITETTVHVTYRPLRESDADTPRSVIGAQIPDLRLYVLDSRMEPVPIGVAGELYVGGEGVARGYLGRPALTAERFIPDPYSGDGERLYRSGDLARRLPDGDLEYLGRADQQVKIRGFRIEPGEIEAQMTRCGQVREAVVMARGEGSARRLVAYMIPAAEVAGDRSELIESVRAELRKQLPDYMVPAAFVVVDALPLTANGKIDRKALPEPDAAEQQSRSYALPETPTEMKLVEYWREALNIGHVGVTSSFFDLGGHSLLAIRLAAHISEGLSKKVPLEKLFEHDTIRELARWLDAQESERAAPVPLAPRNVDLPLSFAQQRLWFVNQIEGGGNLYRVPMVLESEGMLDLNALKKALDTLVERHEILRTTYALREGSPVQVIGPPRSVPLTVLRSESGNLNGASTQTAATMADAPFDLGADLMLRVTVFRTEHDRWILYLLTHHIAFDGWSSGVLTRELLRLYRAYSAGLNPELPALPIQYADYSYWQRRRQDDLESQIAYWMKKLENIPLLHSLPLDRPRPASTESRGRIVVQRLPAVILDSARAVARDHNASLFMVLLAAFSLLIGRWSRAAESVIGSPVAGRTRREFEQLIGCFVNTLVFRTNIASDLTFRELVRQCRETALEAYANQEAPFEALVERLSPARTLAHAPLTQIIFALQNMEGVRRGQSDAANSGLTAKPSPSRLGVDLEVAAVEFQDGLQLSWWFSTDIFEDATIRRMATSFAVLLEAAVGNPETLIGRLPVAAPEDLALIEDWNRTTLDPARPLRLHQLFEAQVSQSAKATAVIAPNGQLTYEELEGKANACANLLRSLNVSAGSVVALYFERSLEMIIGIMGVLKAGGACLPILPGTPHQRVRYIIDDAAPKCLLTTEAWRGVVADSPCPIVAISSSDLSSATPRSSAPTDPESLAYIFYTSGTTGSPNGVCVPHRGLANYVLSRIRRLGLGSDDSFLQNISYTFDPSVSEIFCPLAIGAATILAPQSESFEIAKLQALIARHSVRNVSLAPALLSLIVNSLDPVTQLSSVRRIFCGGEALSPRLKQRVLCELDVDFYNVYGPAECSIEATLCRLNDLEPERVPIGVAHDNVTLHVLDEGLQPVPIGVTGELFIGGMGLATGYLNDVELTKEKFIENPFGGGAGERLYRTGDLVRWSPDGLLNFVGRGDDQVKIRGFRVELGEVENAILALPGITECAVVATREGAERTLAAYVASETGRVDDWKSALRETLPEYMIPSVFVRLDTLPRASTGKVDRSALPAPELAKVSEKSYVAPRTATEVVVCEIWARTLGLERVGVRDDFFVAGGHSLLGVMLVGAVNQELGINLEVSDLFEGPTPEQMARHIARLKSGGSLRLWEERPAIVRLFSSSADQIPLFLAPGAGVTIGSFYPLAQALEGHFRVSVLDPSHIIDFDGSVNLQQAVDRYVQAIRAEAVSGPYYVGGHSAGVCTAYEIAKRLNAENQTVHLLLIDSVPGANDGPVEESAEHVIDRLLESLLEAVRRPTPLGFSRSAGPRQRAAEILASEGLSLTDGEIDALFETWVAQVRLQQEYTAGERLRGDVVFLYAEREWPVRRLTSARKRLNTVAGGELRFSPVGGGHVSMLKEPFVNSLSQAIIQTVRSLEHSGFSAASTL